MYTQSITRNHRTAFVVALDRSGSMVERIRFRGRDLTKAEAVAEVANSLLEELLLRATREGEVRDYYDIAVVGYSGNGVRPLLGEGFVPVTALPSLALARREVSVEQRLPDGSPALHAYPLREWIRPEATGQTPMYEALLHIHELTEAWCARTDHAESFPPLIFNVTDGEASDCDEEELHRIASRIRSLGTADGEALLLNIHLATGDDIPGRLFLTEQETAYCNRYARLLYEMSSPMPALFDEAIRTLRGADVRPPFRGMCYNAPITELLSILNVGSISLNLL